MTLREYFEISTVWHQLLLDNDNETGEPSEASLAQLDLMIEAGNQLSVEEQELVKVIYRWAGYKQASGVPKQCHIDDVNRIVAKAEAEEKAKAEAGAASELVK